ncbi:tripartite tricarboxylate transporter substrate binding protein [Variovorax sp. WS11]|uniref:Bug family tripartite tricarboxylate transporter substrate binding protein n=1 Tax=Variovorax sp. WS11 TaxID=1105204 RepID=UPI000D0CF807|nr:tripartite tricarboxylate transporter substrate binding protein [Variovorax sp. WS11]NDZ17300.1 tripartite tricarboxylate transporter substrate binding protein [Variovorax sp. WS11]PSL80556.1 tripartite tricarboxylate transporter substrate binding protein [Variovorax sp. WS11]
MLSLTRRDLLATLAVPTAGFVLSSGAQAQVAWPSRPVKLVVPQGPGSGSDVVARLLNDRLAQRLGQPVVIENNPAANGLVALSSVAKAAPDGYTLGLAGVSQMAFNPALYKDLPYNPAKDFTYVAPVVDTPFVLVTSNKSGIKTFPQFVEQARKKNGELSFGSAGIGNSTHIAMELIASAAGVKLLHVPYKGSAAALTAVLAGEVDAMVSVVGPALPQVQSGKANAVAVLGAARVPQWPQVPTIKEAGLNVPAMPGWYAVVGPAGLDPKIVSTFNAALQQVMADPAVKSKLVELSLPPIPGGDAEIRQRAASDLAYWSDFIRKNNIRVE